MMLKKFAGKVKAILYIPREDEQIGSKTFLEIGNVYLYEMGYFDYLLFIYNK